jgi:hypothetical protein
MLVEKTAKCRVLYHHSMLAEMGLGKEVDLSHPQDLLERY